MPFRTIEVALRANIAGFQAEMGAAAASVKAFGSDVGKTIAATDAETKKAVETVSKGALLMGAGLVAGFGVAVGAAANFEKEMSGVAAVSGATGAQMRLLGESALKAGADTSFSASEAARGQAELAKAGISTADILGGALTGSLALAAAGQLDVAQAAEISAQAMNIFGLEGRDVGHIADVLAAGANKSAADVGQLGDALRQGGLVAKQTGLSFEETVATLALFADNALVGSDAGTSLKTMLQRLTPTSKESAEMMAQLGFSAYDASGNFIGMEALAGELQTSLGGLTQEQRNTALATMFGSDAVRGANAIYEDGAAGMARYIKMVHDQGFATRSAAELTNNLAGDVERLGGSIETALIRGGSGANTVMRELIQLATGAVNVIGEMPTPLLATATGLAGISGSALLVLGGIGTLIPKLREVQLALQGMGTAGVAAAGILSTLGKAAGIAGLLTAVAMSASAADEALDKIADPRKPVEINKLAGQLTEVGSASELSEVLIGSLGYSLGDLTSRIADVQTRGWLEDFVKGSTYADRAVKELDSTLASMVQGGAIDAAQTQFKVIEADLRAMGLTTEQINAAFPQFTQGMEDAEAAAKVQAAATGEAAGALGGLNQAMGESIPITEEQKKAMEDAKAAAEELQKVHEELAGALAGFVDPMQAFNTVLDANTAAAQRHAEGIAASTADTSDSWQQYATEATVSLDQFAAELQKQIDAQDNWANNLLIITARGRGDVARELAKMGPEGAALVAQFATGTEAEMNRAGDLLMESARRGSLGAGAELDTGLKIMEEIARQGATATVQSVMDALGPMPGLTQELVRDTANRAQITLDEAKPAWDQSWGDRRITSVEQMNALLAEAPPHVRAAAELANQHLIDTNPAFAAQFLSRKGVGVDEMANLLAESPPHVQEAARLYNAWLAEHKPGWDQQYIERRNFAVAEMDLAGRETADKAAAAGDGMNSSLRSRLPPFQGTVREYQTSLVSGIQTVGAASGPGGVRRDTGPARPGLFADGGIVEFYAAGGMKEAHHAQIARAGDWRVWAEPETGGEAYIPLALAKRERSTGILEEVASRFGLAVTDFTALPPGREYHEGGLWPCDADHEGCQHFHSGGLWTPPSHPQFADYGPPIRPAGSGTTHNMQEMAAEFARRHMQEPHHTAPPPGAPISGPASGGGIVGVGRQIQGMGYRVGEHPSFGGVAPVHTQNSYHYRGRAIDVNWYPAAQEPAKLDSLASWIRGNVRPITELLWRTAGHYGHLHLAMARGGIVENGFQSYDQGGVLEPGYTLAHNGTGRPERVLSLAEGGLVNDTFYGGAGSERKRRRRFEDEEGAQFDYMNRRETRATPHAYLDYGTPHNRRDGLRPSQGYRDEWNAVKEASQRDDRNLRRLSEQDALRRMGVADAFAGGSKSPAPVMNVPVTQSNDNSVTLNFNGTPVKVEVRAEVGADPAGMREGILTAVNQAFGAWQDSLKAEIRARRG